MIFWLIWDWRKIVCVHTLYSLVHTSRVSLVSVMASLTSGPLVPGRSG